MKIYTCPHCRSEIKWKLFFGNAHLQCPICKRNYVLDLKSTKIRMIEPFIAVGTAVSCSLVFLQGKTIDIKTVFILGVSFLLAAIMDYFMVRVNILTYEEKKDR